MMLQGTNYPISFWQIQLERGQTEETALSTFQAPTAITEGIYMTEAFQSCNTFQCGSFLQSKAL